MALPTATLTFLLTAAVAVGLMALERLAPNRNYPTDWRWVARATGLGIVGITLTLLLGGLIDAHVAAREFLRQDTVLTRLPAVWQGFCGYVVVTFFVYWWHRLRHHSDRLWLLFHQVHHSTYRLEAGTAFYAHPNDFMANALIVNGVTYGLLGYGLDGAAWASFWVGVFDLWEHTNIRTPRSLGYLVVRPEMHRVHHERDRHRGNYGIPIWDMLFGTYENSLRAVDCGFTPAQEERIGEMLRFRSADRP
jgi:sterol desaturase/sphingolipid hydroxylase (fatty acid hydroxylase superfamily)